MQFDTGWLSLPKVSFINAHWQNHNQGEKYISINPSNRQKNAMLQFATAEQVDSAVHSAKEAFRASDWARINTRVRGEKLKAVAQIIRKHHAELAYLETLDNGKLYRESYEDDIPEAADVFDYYAGWCDKFYGEVCPTSDKFINYITHQPVGVCALIVPWNFPLVMASWKLAPALAMGNSTIIKPAPPTSLSLIYLYEKIHEANIFPKGVINLLLGGPEVGRALCTHRQVDKVAFTGSTAVGKEIVKNSGDSNLKYVSLELGGKSPNIIFDDVDNLDKIIKNSFSAMFSHKGEKCSEPTRFFIHKKHFDYVVEALAEKAQKTRLGNPFDEQSDQGPQCTEEQFNKILRYISIGKEEGATLVCGGERDVQGDNGQGFFIRPTIFKNVKNSMKICQDEIFGPVLTVCAFEHDEEAVRMANDTMYGLAAGLFTRDITRAHRVAAQLDAGMVYINKYGCYDFSSPFGGFKQSGWGKDMAIHSLRSYTKTKSVWVAL